MSGPLPSGRFGEAGGRLGFAAAPTFALMAILTAVHGGSAAGMFCSGAHGASSLDGMVPMYGLMSLFHAAPWVKLIAGRRMRQPPAR